MPLHHLMMSMGEINKVAFFNKLFIVFCDPGLGLLTQGIEEPFNIVPLIGFVTIKTMETLQVHLQG